MYHLMHNPITNTSALPPNSITLSMPSDISRSSRHKTVIRLQIARCTGIVRTKPVVCES